MSRTKTKWAFESVRFSLVGRDGEAKRLAELRRVVDAAGEAKELEDDGRVHADDEALLDRWLPLLPVEALATFEKTPSSDAWLPPSGFLEPDWDEFSMLDGVLAGETNLGEVCVIDTNAAELRLKALAWPCGGIDCLIRLVEAFGFDVVAYNEGSMPEVSRAAHLAGKLPLG